MTTPQTELVIKQALDNAHQTLSHLTQAEILCRKTIESLTQLRSQLHKSPSEDIKLRIRETVAQTENRLNGNATMP